MSNMKIVSLLDAQHRESGLESQAMEQRWQRALQHAFNLLTIEQQMQMELIGSVSGRIDRLTDATTNEPIIKAELLKLIEAQHEAIEQLRKDVDGLKADRTK